MASGDYNLWVFNAPISCQAEEAGCAVCRGSTEGSPRSLALRGKAAAKVFCDRSKSLSVEDKHTSGEHARRHVESAKMNRGLGCVNGADLTRSLPDLGCSQSFDNLHWAATAGATRDRGFTFGDGRR